jgi:broad specificity phosphatase PhoE
MTEAVFLVRHGRYNRTGLSPEGHVDARQARDELIAKNLGGKALVLTSSAQRAWETATIIAKGLKAGLVLSDRIYEGGNDVEAVEDLDIWLQRALEEAKVSVPAGKSLVVVTHAPMVAVAKGLRSYDASDIGNGEIFEYTPGSWHNQDFRESYVEEVENRIAQSRKGSPPAAG